MLARDAIWRFSSQSLGFHCMTLIGWMFRRQGLRRGVLPRLREKLLSHPYPYHGQQARNIQTHLTLKQTTLHPTSLTSNTPLYQRSQYPRLSIVSSQDISHCHSDFDGSTVLFASDMHQAGFGFDDDVVSRVGSVWAGGSVALIVVSQGILWG